MDHRTMCANHRALLRLARRHVDAKMYDPYYVPITDNVYNRDV